MTVAAHTATHVWKVYIDLSLVVFQRLQMAYQHIGKWVSSVFNTTLVLAVLCESHHTGVNFRFPLLSSQQNYGIANPGYGTVAAAAAPGKTWKVHVSFDTECKQKCLIMICLKKKTRIIVVITHFRAVHTLVTSLWISRLFEDGSCASFTGCDFYLFYRMTWRFTRSKLRYRVFSFTLLP